MERLAQFVCERILKVQHAETEDPLVVDDRMVPLTAFACSVIANMLRGLGKSLRGLPAEFPMCESKFGEIQAHRRRITASAA